MTNTHSSKQTRITPFLNKNKNKKSNKLWLFFIGCLGALILGAVLFMQSPLFRVTLTQSELHLELGTSASTQASTYLDGDSWSVPLSYVDTSKVKKNKTGRYPVYIYHGFDTYTCYVNVTDTTAPVVSCDIKTKTVTPGEIVSVDSLGLKIEDYSEISSTAFTCISSTHFYTGLPDEKTEEMREAYKKGLDMFAEEFQFAYGGIYTLTISVEDAFHNSTDVTLTLKVEEPPVIETVTDYYMAIAEEIPFEEYITAWDFLDEDLDSSDVKIDTAELQTGKSGTYPVYFSATDSYGLTTTSKANVHVSTKEDLQELINTHEIDINQDVIVGAYNSYDSGYYEEENISFIQNIMLPSIVYIENDILKTAGSGFIIAIDDAYVTIATNEHVITDDMTPDVVFYDATSCGGAVVAANKKEDIAFIRIPIGEKSSITTLAADYVQKLRTVHINEGYWNSLSNEESLTIGYNCVNKNGKIWFQQSGTMIAKNVNRNWNTYTDIDSMIISMEPEAGTSGSAIFDGYGHLIGMIRGYTDYGSYTETIAVPLHRILKYYEMTFKTKIQYQ